MPTLVHVAGGELVALHDIGYGGCVSRRGRLLQRAVLRHATRVTAASEPICALVAEHGVERSECPSASTYSVGPLGARSVGQEGEPAKLVHVATLNRVKDQGLLLRALRLLADRGRDFRLDVVGEDTWSEIQALAAELGVARNPLLRLSDSA